MKKILVTSALPYANGPIHLGHMVEYIQADIFVRAMRLSGENVKFVCADDTHGTPIEINASKLGMKPEELISKYYKEHTADFADFLISFDNYYSTNSDENKKYSELFFNTLKEKGHINQRMVELTFCENDKRYLPDRYVKGKCPKCGAEDQYGDVCEKCNATYKPIELVNPYCSICRQPPVRRNSLHYFFKLSDFSERLEKWLRENKGLQEETKNYVLDWVSKGLEDWDITRDGPYFGFLIPGETSKYFYVWLDAPIGYIASTEHLTKDALSYWKNQDTKIVHFIGKDIMYFHFLFWPAMLMGMEYNLPDTISVHGFLTVNGEKMSKSRGTFITAREYLEQLDPEFLRFHYAMGLSTNINDLDLDFNEFKTRINSELVDNIANFAYRVLSFANNNFDSKLTNISDDKELIVNVGEKCKHAIQCYRERNFREVMRTILEISTIGNQYFQENKPWQQIKTDKKKTQAVVTTSANILKNIAILLGPVMPKFSDRLLKQLNVTDYTFENLNFELKNHTVNKARIIYTRIEGEPFKTSTFPLNLKVAKVISVEDHPNAEKLLVLKIDIGEEQRQIVAGIKAHYSKESMVGKNIIVVTNLKHAKLRGVESQGMMLAADDGYKLAVVESPKSLPGDKITVEGFTNLESEITFEDFQKVSLLTKGKKAIFDGKILRTEKEELVVDAADGAKIR